MDADDDTVGIEKHVDGFAKPQIFGRHRKMDGLARQRAPRKILQPTNRSRRQLRGHQHHRSIIQQRQFLPDSRNDAVNIGMVIVIDRRVIGDPDQLGLLQGGMGIGGKMQVSGRQTLCNQRVQSRLEQRRLAQVQSGDDIGLIIKAGHLVPELRQTGRSDRSQMPQADNSNPHDARPANTHSLACR